MAQSLADFTLQLTEPTAFAEYENDPEGYIKASDLSPKNKGVMLSRDYTLIRYALEAENPDQDYSEARITIILGIPTIMLFGDDGGGAAAA